MAKVLIVFHSESGNTKVAEEAVAKGAKDISVVKVVAKEALQATAEDLPSCHAIAMGTPDYCRWSAGKRLII